MNRQHAKKNAVFLLATLLAFTSALSQENSAKKDEPAIPKIEALAKKGGQEPLKLEYQNKHQALLVKIYISLNQEIILTVRQKKIISQGFIHFSGQEYELTIQDNPYPYGGIDQIEFYFLDQTKSRNEKFSIQKALPPPFPPEMENDAKKIYNLALDYALGTKPVPVNEELIEQFNLEPFYQKHLKKLLQEQIDKK